MPARNRNWRCCSSASRVRGGCPPSMLTPAMVMRPESGISSWFKQRRKVLLPQPLGPMRTTASPRTCEGSMPGRTRLELKDLVSWSTTIMAQSPFQPAREDGGRITQSEMDSRRHEAEPDVIIGGHGEHPVNLGQFDHGDDG